MYLNLGSYYVLKQIFYRATNSTGAAEHQAANHSSCQQLKRTLTQKHFCTKKHFCKLKFDAHVASVCRKVGGQVNALNRLQNILPCKVKELLYRAFVLPHFYYCSQVWHHCGSRNTKKIEKVNERALRYVYKDKTSAYYELLQRIGLGTTLENRRVQDMLITINACFQGTAPTCIKELVKMRDNKYDLRGNNTLSLPKVNTTKYGLNSFRYFAAKQWNSIPNELRLRAGGLEFNKQVRNIQF